MIIGFYINKEFLEESKLHLVLRTIRHHTRLMKQFHTGWGKSTVLVEFSKLAMVMGPLVDDSNPV